MSEFPKRTNLTSIQYRSTEGGGFEPTQEGRILYHLYYNGIIGRLLKRDEYGGYPHNGGRHTWYLYLEKDDVVAFLDILEEIFHMFPEGIKVLRKKAGIL